MSVTAPSMTQKRMDWNQWTPMIDHTTNYLDRLDQSNSLSIHLFGAQSRGRDHIIIWTAKMSPKQFWEILMFVLFKSVGKVMAR